MGWITPVITWIAGNGIGFSDLNRIEGDLKYLREENKTINGTSTFSNNLIITGGTGDLLQVGSNTDISASIGNTKIFSAFSNHMMLAHPNRATITDYAILQTFGGQTIINASLGGAVEIKNNDNSVALFSGIAIQLLKPVTIENVAHVGAWSVSASFGRVGHKDFNLTNNYGIIQENTSKLFLEGAIVALQPGNGNNVLIGTNIDDTANKLQVAGSGIFSGALTATGKIQSGLSTVIEDWTTSNTVARYGHKDFNLNGGYGYIQNSLGQFNIEGAVNQNCSIGVDGGSQLNFLGLSINVLGNINPTTTPTESSISRTTAGSTNIPRGQYHIEIEVDTSLNAGSVTATLQRLINGTWYTEESLSINGFSTGKELAKGMQESTGSDLRITMSGTITNASVSANLRKY
jgi:hypothetical protein